MPTAQQGSVIWALIPDKNGHSKRRPAVVITETKAICPGATIAGVAVTSRPTIPRPPLHIELPWDKNTHPVTGLFKQCWAVCSWVVTFRFEDIYRVSLGPIPASHFLIIQALVVSLAKKNI
jgi:PemK-like, MazF-like toxin of type II toxin-antitoxin system